MKSGRTNDEVQAAPAATLVERPTCGTRPTPDELAALDALGKSGTWDFGGHQLKLTNLDKVLFPAQRPHPALTKRDLIRHYATIAPAILPYLADRPINLHRFPDGIDGKRFWHKAAPPYAPDWITRWRNDDADPGETESTSSSTRRRRWRGSANYGAIELHPWTSTRRHPQRPTWAMIDIDPGEQATFDDVLDARPAAPHRPRPPRRASRRRR